ncbi:hypothetical protein [Gimesia sp.]|uniref:hypothetical protein n=1 Tax=Gimesia sp. TaxID=2024833 RepID=UPI003A94F004
MRQRQGCQQRNHLYHLMILTLLAASVLPGTTRLVSAEDPEPGKLLGDVGVNSDAGVTGTIDIEPADSSVSAKTAAIAGDVLTAKFFTVPIALFEELNLPSKTMKTLELEPQPVLQDEQQKTRAAVIQPPVVSYAGKSCDVLDQKRVQKIEQLIQSSQGCQVIAETTVDVRNGESLQIPAPPDLASEGGGLRVRYSRSYDLEHAGFLKFWITTPRYKFTKTGKTDGTDSDQKATTTEYNSWRFEETQLLKSGEKFLLEVAVLKPQSENPEVVFAMLEVGKDNSRQVSQAKLQQVSSHSSGAKHVLNADLSQETDRLTTISYPVSDLVTPLPRQVNIARDLSVKSTEPEAPRFDPLVQLIEQTVSPELWDEPQSSGCTIRAYPQMQSLIIRARQATHDQIAACLEQLRAEQNQMLTVGVRFFTVDDLQRWYDRWNASEAETAKELVKRLEKTDLTQGVIVNNAQRDLIRELVYTPGLIEIQQPMIAEIRSIFLHRQSAELDFTEPTGNASDAKCHLQLRPVIQANGDVQVSMSVNPEQSLDPLSNIKAGTIPPEHSLLVDVTDQMNGQAARLLSYSLQRQITNEAGNQKRFLVLVTPSKPLHYTPKAFTPPSR